MRIKLEGKNLEDIRFLLPEYGLEECSKDFEAVVCHGGDGALLGAELYYFNPYRPGELSSAVIAAERDPEEMRRRGARLAERAEQFDWRKTIRETERFITDWER